MQVDIAVATISDPNLPEWSAAEILEVPLADELVLRAVVCRMESGQWRWTVGSRGPELGELISTGVESSPVAARSMATGEIAKCLESALA
jgi:hypothetical protein